LLLWNKTEASTWSGNKSASKSFVLEFLMCEPKIVAIDMKIKQAAVI